MPVDSAHTHKSTFAIVLANLMFVKDFFPFDQQLP